MVARCKPLTKDHLPLKTTFPGTKGWSLVTGFTVYRLYACLWLVGQKSEAEAKVYSSKAKPPPEPEPEPDVDFFTDMEPVIQKAAQVPFVCVCVCVRARVRVLCAHACACMLCCVFLLLFSPYEIHFCPATEVNKGVWWCACALLVYVCSLMHFFFL